MPKISVIMPVYNAEKYIYIAIDSILKQTFEDFELIVVDDNGDDDSIKIVEAFQDSRIRVIHNSCNCGIAYSRNRGIIESKGEYIALMDDDDYAPMRRFEIENNFLDTHSNIAVVGGLMRTIDENDDLIRPAVSMALHNPKRIRAELIFHDVVANGSAMMRREFILNNQIKYYDNLQGMEDYHFWIQCSLFGEIVNLDDVLLYWRQTNNNETYRRKNDSAISRAETFKRIQRFALEKNGFVLTKAELNCFFREFTEGGKYCSSLEELKELFKVLAKMIAQSKGSLFSTELEYVCHHMFGKRVANSYIWNN